jgi:hypothetical protein
MKSSRLERRGLFMRNKDFLGTLFDDILKL